MYSGCLDLILYSWDLDSILYSIGLDYILYRSGLDSILYSIGLDSIFLYISTNCSQTSDIFSSSFWLSSSVCQGHDKLSIHSWNIHSLYADIFSCDEQLKKWRH